MRPEVAASDGAVSRHPLQISFEMRTFGYDEFERCMLKSQSSGPVRHVHIQCHVPSFPDPSSGFKARRPKRQPKRALKKSEHTCPLPLDDGVGGRILADRTQLIHEFILHALKLLLRRKQVPPPHRPPTNANFVDREDKDFPCDIQKSLTCRIRYSSAHLQCHTRGHDRILTRNKRPTKSFKRVGEARRRTWKSTEGLLIRSEKVWRTPKDAMV